jgi:hypothetical protein
MNPIIVPANARFPLGSVYITAHADKTLSRDDVAECIIKHAIGVWGDLSQADKDANDEALTTGGRLLSAYYDREGIKFWIITEADRSATTVLLPEDY